MAQYTHPFRQALSGIQLGNWNSHTFARENPLWLILHQSQFFNPAALRKNRDQYYADHVISVRVCANNIDIIQQPESTGIIEKIILFHTFLKKINLLIGV